MSFWSEITKAFQEGFEGRPRGSRPKKRAKAARPSKSERQREIWYFVSEGGQSMGPMTWRSAEEMRKGYLPLRGKVVRR